MSAGPPVPAGASSLRAGTPVRPRRSLNRVASSPMIRLLGRRLLAGVFVLWGTTFLAYAGINALPGNGALQILGAGATQQQVAALTQRLGLDRPFVTRYWDWLTGVLHGQFGSSLLSGAKVTTVISQGFPVTVELALLSFLVALLAAIPVALLAASRPEGFVDRMISLASLAGLSIAPYILGVVLVIVFAIQLHWFPAIGWTPLSKDPLQNLRSVVLPCIALGLPFSCIYVRVLRADLVEQMSSEPYVETARAKGARRWRVLIRHALRNSAFALITVAGVNLGTLLGSTVIVEQMFSLPGLGRQLFQAVSNEDATLAAGLVLIFAAAVVLANLLTDVLYTVLDPRTRRGRSDG